MLKSTEKKMEPRAILRPRIYCGIHPAPPPCSLAAKKYSTLPKKRAAPTISSRASLFHSSSVTMLLDKASSYNNFSVYLLVNDNIMYNVVVCSPE